MNIIKPLICDGDNDRQYDCWYNDYNQQKNQTWRFCTIALKVKRNRDNRRHQHKIYRSEDI